MAGPKPLRADARRNQQRLLQVAKDAFAAEGLSVPLDEIARRAGVGPGTLYRHFPTKEALLEAVLHDRLQRLADDARELRQALDPATALLDFIDRLVAEAAPKRDLADALASAGAELNAALTATAARLRVEIGHLLARAQHTGAIRGDITAADLMAIITGVLVALRPRPGDQADPQRTIAVIRDGLRAVPLPAAQPGQQHRQLPELTKEHDARDHRQRAGAARGAADYRAAGSVAVGRRIVD